MTKTIISVSVVALLFAGVASSDPHIKFDLSLDCTSCIRGGYEYCIYGDYVTAGNPTGSQWNCTETQKNPNVVWPSGSIKSGYVCSSALKSQSAAIIAGCRPEAKQFANSTQCGEYLVDLSTNVGFGLRQLKDLPANTSCSYRVMSNCGYPAANIAILDPLLESDFDIIYATRDNIIASDDLGKDFVLENTNVDWEGSFTTGSDESLTSISEGPSKTFIDNASFQKCNNTLRSLWVTVTRVKVTKPAAESLLDVTPRLLQGRGLKTYEIEIGFGSIQGGNSAKFLGAISFALVALLSVFAF